MEIELLERALSVLGKTLGEVSLKEDKGTERQLNNPDLGRLAVFAVDSAANNPWFTPDFVLYAMQAWAKALQPDKVRKWLASYPLAARSAHAPKRVGVVMAGNLPMVGLHDLLCVLASGNKAVVKLSGQDDRLIPGLTELLCRAYPELQQRIVFTKGTLTGIDAIIATGSNNTSRYFEYYFGKYPNIIRRNRNGVAVIKGNESSEWFRELADDIFLYFGLGCRNVSKLYIPAGFDVEALFPYFEGYRHLADNHKYFNNYEYQKSILLINQIPFHDNGFLLMRNRQEIPTAVSVLHYEEYTDEKALKEELDLMQEQIQCIVSDDQGFPGSVKAGKTQQPELWDYADGVDTMEFLCGL